MECECEEFKPKSTRVEWSVHSHSVTEDGRRPAGLDTSIHTNTHIAETNAKSPLHPAPSTRPTLQRREKNALNLVKNSQGPEDWNHILKPQGLKIHCQEMMKESPTLRCFLNEEKEYHALYCAFFTLFY